MTAPPLRWGVVGATSWVARDAVLPAIAASPHAELVAVASRDAERARAVATGFGARRASGDYIAVLADPDVEAVYIPLPNHLHAGWTRLAADAGRHVLCEKPLGCSAAEVEAMQQAAAAAGVVLVEAYMTQFHPRHRLAVDLARDGAVGRPTRMSAAFTFPLTDAHNHRWRRDAGGGALLDVGVYCVAPLLEIAGREPEAVSAHATPGGDGVDATTVATLDFGDGLQGSVECSFERPERQSLVVEGTEGTLRVDRPFTCGPDDTALTLERPGAPPQTLRTTGVNAYAQMVDAVHALVRGGAPRVRTAEATLAVARTLDRIAAAATR